MSALSRNASIDRIRGVAIAMVVVFHYYGDLPTAFWPLGTRLARYFFAARGQYGATIFFVVSGFLITTISLQRWKDLRSISVRDFYIFRAARIIPALLLLLVALWMLHFLDIAPFNEVSRRQLQISMLKELAFPYYGITATTGSLGTRSLEPVWSLSVEEAFYVVFPMACLLLRDTRKIVAVIIAMILAGPPLHAIYIFNSLGFSLDALAIGCSAAIIAPKIHLSADQARKFKLAAAVAIAISILLIGRIGPIAPSLIGLSAAFYLIGAAFLPGDDRGFFDKLLQRCGRTSYEIYLFHMPIIVLFTRFGRDQSPWLMALQFVLYLSLTIFVGAAIKRYFTDPLNYFLRAASRRSRPQILSTQPKS